MTFSLQGEEELFAFEGMNLFAAIAILCKVNLNSVIVDMTSEQRMEWFAGVVGYNRMV